MASRSGALNARVAASSGRIAYSLRPRETNIALGALSQAQHTHKHQTVRTHGKWNRKRERERETIGSRPPLASNIAFCSAGKIQNTDPNVIRRQTIRSVVCKYDSRLRIEKCVASILLHIVVYSTRHIFFLIIRIPWQRV